MTTISSGLIFILRKVVLRLSNIFEYKDPIIYNLRAGTSSDQFKPFAKVPYKVVDNMFLLDELPDPVNRVQINEVGTNTPYYEVDYDDVGQYEFKVNYTIGFVRFHPLANGKNMSVSYFGRGQALIPASRIWIKEVGGTVTDNLQEIIDNVLDFNYTGEYVPNKPYKKFNIVSYQGASYIAKRDGSALPTNLGYWDRLSGFKLAGNYNASTTYLAGDIVSNTGNNSLYYSLISNNKGNPLSDQTKWLTMLDVQPAINNANRAAELADEKANLAKQAAQVADQATERANTATSQANAATNSAKTAAQTADQSAANANTKAAHAQTQGDYAKTQGQYATTQGDYAKQKGNEALAAKTQTETATSNSITATNEAKTATQNAQTATSAANTATTQANTATQNANSAATTAQNKADSFIYLGDYEVSRDYKVNNQVTHNGSTWICVKNSKGNVPGQASSFWKAFAQGGEAKLTRYMNTVTLSASSNTAGIGIPPFNRNADLLLVYQNSVFIAEGQDYTISSNNQNIVKTGGTPWEANTTFNFVVVKNVPTVESGSIDGSFILDNSLTDEKLGDRMINDSLAPTSDSGKLSSLFSWLGNRIKSITGEASWRTAPSITMKAIKTILDTLSESSALPMPITTGTSVIETTQATPATVEFKGRTLVNLLGNAGNCERISPFVVIPAGKSEYDPTVSRLGSTGSIKNTQSDGQPGRAIRTYPNSLDKTKAYLLAGWIYIQSVESGAVAALLETPVIGTADYSARADSNKLNQWQFVYTLVPKDNKITGSGFSLRLGGAVTSNVSVANYDDFRLYEITDEEYAAIGTTIVGDDIDRQFPYVDSVQHAQGLSVRVAGKNILSPDLASLNVQASIIRPYKLRLNATAAGAYSYIAVKVKPNTRYTLRMNIVGANTIRCNVNRLSSNGSTDNSYGSFFTSAGVNIKTFTTDADKDMVYINMYCTAAGTYDFEDWVLVLGGADQLPTNFVPSRESYVNVPTTLASNVDSSIADSYDSATKRVLRRWATGVILDASLGFATTGAFNGFKYIFVTGYFPTNNNMNMRAVKYNGDILGTVVGYNFTAGDQLRLDTSSSVLGLSVNNTDSGWVNGLAPDVVAIKAFLNGWKATTNNGSIYTSWVSILDGSSPAINIGTWPSENKAPNWDAWATLDYVRATPITETLSGDLGGLSLSSGGSQVELIDGVIVRESIKPVFGLGNWRINDAQVQFRDSLLKNKLAEFIGIYRSDGTDDTSNWKIVAASPDSPRGGLLRATRATDIDPSETYYVTYRVLDRHRLTAGVRQATVIYQASIGSVVSSNVQNITELQRKDGMQDFALDYIEAKADNNAIDLVTLSGKVGDLSTLQTAAKNNTVAAINELFQDVGNGKNTVASAITDMGQAISGSATFAQLATKIRDISNNANAVATEVLSGKSFYSGGVLREGIMPNRGIKTFTPKPWIVHIPAGYYADGSLIEATPPERGLITFTPAPWDVHIPAGIYEDGSKVAAVTNLSAGNIKQGSTVGGVAGNFTNDADAVAGEVLLNKKAYVKGSLVTGTMPHLNGVMSGQSSARSGTNVRIRPQAGYYTGGTGNFVEINEPNLLAGNIRQGVSIFGLTGTSIPGRRFAEGVFTIVDDGGMALYRYTPSNGSVSSFSSYPKISRTGLGFTPRIVTYVCVSTTNIYKNVTSIAQVRSRTLTLYNRDQTWSVQTTNVDGTAYFAYNGEEFLFNGGFRLPFPTGGVSVGDEIIWQAWE